LRSRGENRKTIDVFVVANNERLGLIAVVAYKKEIANPGEAALRLLKYNDESQTGAVSIDGDEDFVITNYFDLKTLNVDSFKNAVQAVAASADDAHGMVRSLAPATGVSTEPTVRRSTRSAFRTPDGATRKVEILAGNASVSMDPKKWQPRKSDEPGRLEFVHQSGDGYAMVISERIEFALPKLRELALDNARNVSPDLVIAAEETRNVNGVDVLMMHLETSMSGVKLSYLGYYWSGSTGSVQVLTYTGTNLLSEYRRDFEDFLNGFQVRQ
jgi:hypothetical protein